MKVRISKKLVMNIFVETILPVLLDGLVMAYLNTIVSRGVAANLSRGVKLGSFFLYNKT